MVYSSCFLFLAQGFQGLNKVTHVGLDSRPWSRLPSLEGICWHLAGKLPAGNPRDVWVRAEPWPGPMVGKLVFLDGILGRF